MKQQNLCKTLAPPPAAFACCSSTGRARLHAGLLSALEQIQTQPLQDLLAVGSVARLVRSVGIQPAPIWGANLPRTHEQSLKRGRLGFGSEVDFFINYTAGLAKSSGVKHDGKGLPAMGLWQLPQQFECLLLSLSARVTAAPNRSQRTATVGTWSGWTDLVLAAFFRRFSERNRHFTFDVHNHVSSCIAALLDQYNVTRVQSGWYGGNESWEPMALAHRPGARSYPAMWSEPVLDFCMIDGGHSHAIASRDFRTMRSACRVIAFHDIVNHQEVGHNQQPRLWRELTTPGHKSYASEFSASNCTQQPARGKGMFMGLGVLTRRTW